MSLLNLEKSELDELAAKVRKDYEELKAMGLQLDLTRGKPAKAQLSLSNDLLELPGAGNYSDAAGNDLRNYGNLEGIKELRELWGKLTNIDPELLLAGDSSSLNIMFDLISWACAFGTNDSERPWSQEETVKWICPVPGYDRHFAITEHFGFELISVPMLSDGPDLGAVKELVKDPQVKGMWTVPMFGNPTGVTISEEIAQELASMEAAAPDFRIIWDNAYAVHTLTDEFPEILPILDIAAKASNPNRFWAMSSTSKITFAGAGVAFFASSRENLDWYLSHAKIRGIGPNKSTSLLTTSSSAPPKACVRSCAATRRCWLRSSTLSCASFSPAWASTRSRSGPSRRAATSSPSTSSMAPPPASGSWRRMRASC